MPTAPRSTANRPLLHNSLKLREAIGQCGRPGPQNRGRFNFVEILVLHGWDAVEASPRCNVLRPEFLAAPRADDQIRFPRNHLLNHHDTALGGALISAIGENVDAAGDLDEFRDPSNSGDQRLVPFLEEYPWPLRQPLRTASRSGQARFERP